MMNLSKKIIRNLEYNKNRIRKGGGGVALRAERFKIYNLPDDEDKKIYHNPQFTYKACRKKANENRIKDEKCIEKDRKAHDNERQAVKKKNNSFQVLIDECSVGYEASRWNELDSAYNSEIDERIEDDEYCNCKKLLQEINNSLSKKNVRGKNIKHDCNVCMSNWRDSGDAILEKLELRYEPKLQKKLGELLREKDGPEELLNILKSIITFKDKKNMNTLDINLVEKTTGNKEAAIEVSSKRKLSLSPIENIENHNKSISENTRKEKRINNLSYASVGKITPRKTVTKQRMGDNNVDDMMSAANKRRQNVKHMYRREGERNRPNTIVFALFTTSVATLSILSLIC